MKKNTSGQSWYVFAFDMTNSNPVLGDAANITAKIIKDGGAATATNDVNPTELEDGYYEFTLTQAETNADHCLLLPESSTSNVQVLGSPACMYTTDIAAWVDAVWDEPRTAHTTANTFGKYLDTDISGIAAGTSPSTLKETTIDVLSDQKNFTLADGSPDDDAYNGMQIIIVDGTDPDQISVGKVADYTGSSLAVVMVNDADFTIANGDNVKLIAQADHISLCDTVTTNTDALTAVAVNTEVDTALTDFAGPTLVELQTELGLLNNISSSEVQVASNAALVANHLDHLLAAAYNPDAKPGVADALLNELVVSDGGVSQFSANTLELSPTATSPDASPTLLQSTTIATLASQVSFTLTAGSDDDDAYIDSLAVITDAATTEQKAFARVSDYVGGTKTITLAADPAIFTMAIGDAIRIMAPISITATENTAAITTGLATLNDLSAAEVNTEVDTALTDYDAATGAELIQEIATVAPANMLATTVATVTDTTNYILTAGSPDDDVYNGQICLFTDQTTAEQVATGLVTDYVASTQTLTVETAPEFAIAAGDSVSVYATVDITDISTAVSSILSVTNIPQGEEEGFPEEILVGDAYTVANGREIKMYFKDDTDTVIDTFGTKTPADADFIWYLRFTPKALPAGTVINAQVEIEGDENDWIVPGGGADPYLQVELPSLDLDDLTVTSGKFTQDYTWQLILQWGGTDDFELTPVVNGEVTVRRKLETEA